MVFGIGETEVFGSLADLSRALRAVEFSGMTRWLDWFLLRWIEIVPSNNSTSHQRRFLTSTGRMEVLAAIRAAR